ncbi:MAG: amino acid adenylation domain-containing protein, partial [Planctomycetes bacterium]|nr:amino acid adenylation domain-containing protein [Planctomycetota bacterium]
TEQEKLQAWNQTETDYPKELTIVDLFEAQVEKTPDNIALVFENQQLSYRELNRKSNQLAHYLLSLKTDADNGSMITDNCIVGICVERSLEMVIGLLGILKTGSAYVPLDPDYPLSRLQFMLEDSEVPVLLTQSHLLERLPVTQESGVEVVCLDTEMEQISCYSIKDPVRQSRSENLAYVIYTSGSTGEPKGVCTPQQAVVRLVQQTNYACLDAGQTFLQYAPVSFDAATLEIWGALLNGAKLIIMPPHKSSLSELSELLQKEKVTILWLTSSLFNLMMDEQPKGLLGIKQLLVGGEELSVSHIERALNVLPGTQLINGYGPTENTTFTSCYKIIQKDYPVSIPLGKPIANTFIYILDKFLQPLPIGLFGELYTGGAGLARGYLNCTELTAQKFTEIEIFGKRERLYKTGDLARWLPDGNLEFLGRLDNQVKLRGFRIELGEIETILSKHESVKEAVVV